MSKIEVTLKADPALLAALTVIAGALKIKATAHGAAEDDLLSEDDTENAEDDFFAEPETPPKPARVAKPVKEEKGPQKITVEMLRELGASLMKDAKKTAKFKALLTKVGAANLGKVPEEKRAAFYSAMQKI